MRFYVVDTLTSRILEELHPTRWELGDPLREPGTGTLTIPRPAEDTRKTLVEFTRPRRRWIAALDDPTGRWVWGGPITKHPTAAPDTVTIPVTDWRTWLYHAFLRPTETSLRDDYVATGRDQGLIAGDLLARALTPGWPPDSHLGFPPIIIDLPPVTGIPRDLTARMLERPVGELLDDLVGLERGIEWWTYVTGSTTNPQTLEVHVGVGWPERRYRTGAPLLVEHRRGHGGNTSDASWPAQGEASTRVWAIGDGEPPDQVWAAADDPDAEVLWETRTEPGQGTRTTSGAFEHAYGALTQVRGRDGTAEFTLPDHTVGLGDLEPGDRVRVVYDDGWNSVDITGARVTGRTMSGGRGQPTQQRITVDLADTTPPPLEVLPGENEPGVPGESVGP